MNVLIKLINFVVLLPILFFSSIAYAADICETDSQSVMCILQRISDQLPALNTLLMAGAYIVGIFFIIKALFMMRRLGEARTMVSHEHSLKEPLILLVIGTMLMSLPSAFNMATLTFFSEGLDYPYSYVVEGASQWCNVLKIAYNVIYFVGLIAFIRGLVILSHLGAQHGQQGGMAKGLTHIIGGIFCMNMQQFLIIIFITLGQSNPLCQV
jgi:hypothetical protein